MPAKKTAEAPEKPAKAKPASSVFHAARGFTDGKSERKFAAGSKTTIGAAKGDISQADAELFVKVGHGKVG